MKLGTEKYLYCPEARMIRYELGKTPYAGACTDGVNICAVFCYQSEDKQRLTLIHVNPLTTKDTLLEVAQWISKNGRCKVYSKNKKHRNLVTNETVNIPGLDLIRDPVVSQSCDYQVEVIDTNIDGFVFRADGEVRLLENLNQVERVYHPYHSQMDTCYKLHETFGYNDTVGYYFVGKDQLRQQLLIFDGTDWQEVGSHDLVLHPLMKNLLGEFNFSNSESFLSIQRTLIKEFRLKMVRKIPGFEKTKDLQRVWDKLSASDKMRLQNISDEMHHTAATQAAILLNYLNRNNLKQGFVNSIRAELSIEPFAKTEEDKTLYRDLITALKDQDPIARVFNVLSTLQRDTDFKSNIIGVVLGHGGLLTMYNASNLGQWIDLSSVEEVICQSNTIGLAFRTLAAEGTVAQLKTLAPLVHKLEGSGKSGKTALHFAAEHNSPQMVAYLLELGIKSNLTDASGNKPIDYCTKPESIALLKAHSLGNDLN